MAAGPEADPHGPAGSHQRHRVRVDDARGARGDGAVAERAAAAGRQVPGQRQEGGRRAQAAAGGRRLSRARVPGDVAQTGQEIRKNIIGSDKE